MPHPLEDFNIHRYFIICAFKNKLKYINIQYMITSSKWHPSIYKKNCIEKGVKDLIESTSYECMRVFLCVITASKWYPFMCKRNTKSKWEFSS